jgi:hypothetical protein
MATVVFTKRSSNSLLVKLRLEPIDDSASGGSATPSLGCALDGLLPMFWIELFNGSVPEEASSALLA